MVAIMLTLARNWWVLVVRGILAVLFGILAFVLPEATVTALVILFGAFMLVDGVFALVSVWRRSERRTSWWPFLLEGLSGIAIGVITFFWPDVTAFALLYLIAAWAFVTGVFEIAAAIRLRKEIRGELFLGMIGVASIAFAALVILFPGEGAVAIVWAIGAYAVVFGILLVVLGLRLRRLHPEREPRLPAP
jgi:uncharacterized membrane protein HdeD (DUF308 family)